MSLPGYPDSISGWLKVDVTIPVYLNTERQRERVCVWECVCGSVCVRVCVWECVCESVCVRENVCPYQVTQDIWMIEGWCHYYSLFKQKESEIVCECVRERECMSLPSYTDSFSGWLKVDVPIPVYLNRERQRERVCVCESVCVCERMYVPTRLPRISGWLKVDVTITVYLNRKRVR